MKKYLLPSVQTEISENLQRSRRPFGFSSLSKNQRLYNLITKKAEIKHNQLLEKNRSISDSINYAKSIQKAVLPGESKLSKAFTESFVLDRPKDIVSGDFYWFNVRNNIAILAVADCTGHGVPAAFTSMLGATILHYLVIEQHLTCPAFILNKLHCDLRKILNQYEVEDPGINDGMEIGIFTINLLSRHVEYSGANRSLYFYKSRENKMSVIKGDKMGVGGKILGKERQFSKVSFWLERNDVIYQFSDGFPDQFGGSFNKRMMNNRFKMHLESIANWPLAEQKRYLCNLHEKWKGKNEQLDDILVVGLKV